ncbi:MAG: hypothetical protein QOH28_99, partial [Actinomycetota bacterium]|nr:hypothetical protein [Actinomycetota bacterium]
KIAQLPGAEAFQYKTDGTSLSRHTTANANPPRVAPHPSALIALTFEPSNFAGTLTLATTPSQAIRISGPSVNVPNTATERA